MEKIKVENARLYEEDGIYYIDVSYLCQNDKVVKRVHFPKVRLPIDNWTGDYDIRYSPTLIRHGVRIDAFLNFVEFHLVAREKDGVCYTEEIVEEKAVEMTLDELEKKLGHKIKIVSDK